MEYVLHSVTMYNYESKNNQAFKMETINMWFRNTKNTSCVCSAAENDIDRTNLILDFYFTSLKYFSKELNNKEFQCFKRHLRIRMNHLLSKAFNISPCAPKEWLKKRQSCGFWGCGVFILVKRKYPYSQWKCTVHIDIHSLNIKIILVKQLQKQKHLYDQWYHKVVVSLTSDNSCISFFATIKQHTLKTSIYYIFCIISMESEHKCYVRQSV